MNDSFHKINTIMIHKNKWNYRYASLRISTSSARSRKQSSQKTTMWWRQRGKHTMMSVYVHCLLPKAREWAKKKWKKKTATVKKLWRGQRKCDRKGEDKMIRGNDGINHRQQLKAYKRQLRQGELTYPQFADHMCMFRSDHGLAKPTSLKSQGDLSQWIEEDVWLHAFRYLPQKLRKILIYILVVSGRHSMDTTESYR